MAYRSYGAESSSETVGTVRANGREIHLKPFEAFDTL